MQKFLLALIILSAVFTSNAQQPNFTWVKQTGGTGNQANNNLVLDTSGNVYTLGTFSGTVDFDPGAGTSIATSIGANDIYIQKLDAAGNFIWVSTFNCSTHARTNALAVDASGVYVTASFKGTVDFDPGAGTTTLTSVPNATVTNACIIKLTAAGALSWVKTLDIATIFTKIDPTAITVDNTGDIYAAGSFYGTIDLNPGTASYTVASAGGYGADAYLLKLDNGGNYVWSKVFGGTSDIDMMPTCVKTDQNNDVGICGSYTSGVNANNLVVDFDPSPGTYTVGHIGNGKADAFISKFTAAGIHQWAKVISEEYSQDTYNDFEFDNIGNVYLTGRVSEDNVDFDPGIATYTVPIYYGYLPGNPFIQKLSNTGNFVWAKFLRDASYYGDGLAIALDNANNVYTTGKSGGDTDMDTGQDTFMVHAPNDALYNTTDFNVYVSKLNQNGDFVWGRNLVGAADNFGRSIAISSQNDIYVAGSFVNTVNFASSPLGTQTLTSIDVNDAYVFKWSQCGTVQTVTGTAVCKYTYMGQTYPATGTYYKYSTAQGGCDSMTIVKVSIQPLTTSLTISGGALVSTELNATSYQWYRCYQGVYSLLNGQTTASYTPLPNDYESYAVAVVSSQGCADTSECRPVMIVGLRAFQGSLEARYFPNPLKDKFTLELSQQSDWIIIEIYNAIGCLVEKTTVENTTKAELNLSGSSGIYFAKIKTPQGQKTIKLIKE